MRGRSAVDPDQRVDGFEQNVDDQQPAGDAPEHVVDAGADQGFAAEFLRQGGDQRDETRAHRGGGKHEQEKRRGPHREALAEGERAPAQNSVQAAQRALMEERQERAHAGQDGHQLVQFELEHQRARRLPQPTIPQHLRDVLDRQHAQVAGDAEGHFGEHRMDIGIPERVPEAQRLPDVDGQHADGAAVADEADHDRALDHRAQLLDAQDIEQKAGEERTRAQRDHGEVEEDPQAEREPVIHVGLVQAQAQAQIGGIKAESQQRRPGRDPQRELRQRAAVQAALDQSAVRDRPALRNRQQGASHGHSPPCARTRAPTRAASGSRPSNRCRSTRASGRPRSAAPSARPDSPRRSDRRK